MRYETSNVTHGFEAFTVLICIGLAGQKFVVKIPREFERVDFAAKLSAVAKKYHGKVVTSLRAVPGLLWWW